MFQPTNQPFETPRQRQCKVKKRKEEVKQAPEKPSQELKIMQDISKSLQSTPSSNDLFDMMVAAEIKNVSLKKKKREIKFEIDDLLFKYQEYMLQQFHNHLPFRHHLLSKSMALQTQIYPAFH